MRHELESFVIVYFIVKVEFIAPLLNDVREAKAHTNTVMRCGAKNGSKTEAAVKDQKRLTLENLLLKLAAYVTIIADTDRTIMLSSGFDLVKKRQPCHLLKTPDHKSGQWR